MKADPTAVAVIVALMVAGNVAVALSVPDLLDRFTPAMPHGLREGESPVVDAHARFVDVADAVGIRFTRYHWTEGDLPYPAVIGGGVAAADVDGNGWTDLFFPPGGPDHPAALYLNRGNWSFEEAAASRGLDVRGFGTGASFGDFDNDGDADLYVVVDEGGRLFRNDGSGAFSDVTADAGVSLAGACGTRACQGASVAWLDHDGDGLLDLYVVNNLDWRMPGLGTSGNDYASLIYFAPRQSSVLFRNHGDGTFSDVTDAAGVPNTGKGLGVTTLDVDGDGAIDIATANDITENALYRNTGDGAFANEARDRGVSEVKTSMGVAAGDVDGDGRPDIVVSNFRGHLLSLLTQEADGTFRYDTTDRGLGASWKGTGWGVALFDYDLDGWLDIAHGVGRAVPVDPHRYDIDNLVFPDLLEDAEDHLFRNLGNGHFGDATASAGFAGHTNTRGVLAVDLDNDGDEDVVRVNLQGQPAEVLRNDQETGHGWLQVDLVGTMSNRDGIGARVTVTLADGRVLIRDVASSAGYQTGLPGIVTVGLGGLGGMGPGGMESKDSGPVSESGAHGPVHVSIRWPSGTVQSLELETGRHRIVEPSPDA